MPLTSKGKKILKAFTKFYGTRGRKIFYAASNKGSITGVRTKRKKRK